MTGRPIIENYLVVNAPDELQLVIQVNAMLAAGYEPLGGVGVQAPNGAPLMLYQAMVRFGACAGCPNRKVGQGPNLFAQPLIQSTGP